MKKRFALLLAAVLFLADAPATFAAGINLFWDDCGAGGGITDKTFACNTNDGYHDLYISVDPPPNVTLTNGHNHIIDLQSLSSPLPAWWEFKHAGTCRQASLIGSGDFSTGPSGGTGCTDPWQGAGSVGVAAYSTNFNGVPNRVRMIGSVSVAGYLAGPMNQGTEYYSAKFRINSAKTVGTGACAGCLDPVCLVLNLVRIAQLPDTPGGDQEVGTPLYSNYVLWHPSAWTICFTPVFNRTWGQIKTLYR